MRKGNEIGEETKNWGPFFKVSVEVKINEYPRTGKWAGILYFIGKYEEGGEMKTNKVPGIDVHSSGKLCVRSWIGEDKRRCVTTETTKNKWYNITIENRFFHWERGVRKNISFFITVFLYFIRSDSLLLSMERLKVAREIQMKEHSPI